MGMGGQDGGEGWGGGGLGCEGGGWVGVGRMGWGWGVVGSGGEEGGGMGGVWQLVNVLHRARHIESYEVFMEEVAVGGEGGEGWGFWWLGMWVGCRGSDSTRIML